MKGEVGSFYNTIIFEMNMNLIQWAFKVISDWVHHIEQSEHICDITHESGMMAASIGSIQNNIYPTSNK